MILSMTHGEWTQDIAEELNNIVVSKELKELIDKGKVLSYIAQT